MDFQLHVVWRTGEVGWGYLLSQRAIYLTFRFLQLVALVFSSRYVLLLFCLFGDFVGFIPFVAGERA